MVLGYHSGGDSGYHFRLMIILLTQQLVVRAYGIALDW
jgi:hypothetical protein